MACRPRICYPFVDLSPRNPPLAGKALDQLNQLSIPKDKRLKMLPSVPKVSYAETIKGTLSMAPVECVRSAAASTRLIIIQAIIQLGLIQILNWSKLRLDGLHGGRKSLIVLEAIEVDCLKSIRGMAPPLLTLNFKKSRKSFYCSVNSKGRVYGLPPRKHLGDMEASDLNSISSLFAKFLEQPYTDQSYMNVNSHPYYIEDYDIFSNMKSSNSEVFNALCGNDVIVGRLINFWNLPEGMMEIKLNNKYVGPDNVLKEFT
uniref:Uncharacterized protein n=1 Tax=Glossina pallidipes TaxID=7398 RepID=A0A1A9ZG10_GLOPL